MLEEKLKQADMEKLFAEIEMPLTRVLHDMEMEGIRANPQALKDYGDALVERIGELKRAFTKRRGRRSTSIRPSSWARFCSGK